MSQNMQLLILKEIKTEIHIKSCMYKKRGGHLRMTQAVTVISPESLSRHFSWKKNIKSRLF